MDGMLRLGVMAVSVLWFIAAQWRDVMPAFFDASAKRISAKGHSYQLSSISGRITSLKRFSKTEEREIRQIKTDAAGREYTEHSTNIRIRQFVALAIETGGETLKMTFGGLGTRLAEGQEIIAWAAVKSGERQGEYVFIYIPARFSREFLARYGELTASNYWGSIPLFLFARAANLSAVATIAALAIFAGVFWGLEKTRKNWFETVMANLGAKELKT